MTLRVTQGMMHLQLMRNLNRNMNQMSDLQNQTATGRKINKPSDDPVGITYSVRYRSELAANEQYSKNVDAALSWLDYNDTVLDQAGTVLKRVKELAVLGSNGTNPDVSLDSIKNEIIQLKSQLVDIANSKFNGKYVFNGEQFDKAPYDAADPKSSDTDKGVINYSVGANITMDINFTGNQVFGEANAAGDSDNMFSVLDRVITALDNGEYDKVAAEINNIESSSDRILNIRSEVGARVNRVELMQNRLADTSINLTDMKSKTEDADFEKLLINAQINENIYQASLAVGAKVVSKSLVDFLS